MIKNRKALKNILLTIVFTAAIVLIAWIGIVRIDYSRMQALQYPLFLIHGDRQMAGGGEVDEYYYGVGYSAYRSLHSNGPFFIELGFSPYFFPIYHVEDVLKPFAYYDEPFYFLKSNSSEFIIVYIVPIIIAFLFYKFIPKLLFMNPVCTCVLIYIILRANDIVFVFRDHWDVAPYGDWPHVVGLLPYFVAITFAFYLLKDFKNAPKKVLS